MTRWLKHRTDGTIYEWDPILDKHPKLIEVTEQEAFPERFVPVAAIEAVEKKRGRKPRATLNLHTDDIPKEPEYSNEELNREATRGLPE
jgi:hypothetical protein